MDYETASNLVLQNKEFKNGNEVATLISEDYITGLYTENENPLLFRENGKVYNLLNMVTKSDCDKILKGIEEYKNNNELTKLIEIDFYVD